MIRTLFLYLFQSTSSTHQIKLAVLGRTECGTGKAAKDGVMRERTHFLLPQELSRPSPETWAFNSKHEIVTQQFPCSYLDAYISHV